METRTSTDGNGNTTTHQVRVNTHFASMGGQLAAMDSTSTFQPNLKKANVALSCNLSTVIDPQLSPEYAAVRKSSFARGGTGEILQVQSAQEHVL